MNAIHQISLKLQLGIHPAAEVPAEILRAMWRERSHQQYKALKQKQESTHSKTHQPSLRRAD
jgi:hypothetical protein